jgi:hypothetical protein
MPHSNNACVSNIKASADSWSRVVYVLLSRRRTKGRLGASDVKIGLQLPFRLNNKVQQIVAIPCDLSARQFAYQFLRIFMPE